MSDAEVTADRGAASRPKRPERPPRRLMTIGGVVALCVAVLGILAHFVSVHGAPLLGIVAISPYLMLSGGVAGAVLLSFARDRVGVVAAAVVLAVAISTQARLYIASPAPADGRSLVVMTSNLRLGEADPNDIVGAVRRHGVEALMLEELTPEEMAALEVAGLDRELPYHIAEPLDGGSGTGLWSRYPLRDQQRVSGFLFAMVTARAIVPGVAHAPRIVATHMAGPYPDARGWQIDIAALPATLRRLAAEQDASVIVGGDFNATTDTAQFRNVLRDGYHDAADQAGAGYPRSWPANRWYPPLIAIDHVLTRGAVGTSANTVEIAGSDHRALVVTIRIPRG